MSRFSRAGQALSQRLEPLRASLDNLSERERRLLWWMGLSLLTAMLFLPSYLFYSAVSDLESDNQAIRDLLRELGRDQDRLRERLVQQRAAQARYRSRAPALGSFVEQKARAQGINLREVSDEPDTKVAGFVRRTLSVRVDDVGLRPLMLLWADIDNSPHAVVISKAEIEHFEAGDKYSVRFDVSAYDAATGGDAGEAKP
ncbi:MAG: hypothetical protein ACPGUV_03955 [Polyangiales bacterium]